MILGIKDQYPDAKDSVIQRAKYEEKNSNVKKISHKKIFKYLKEKNI